MSDGVPGVTAAEFALYSFDRVQNCAGRAICVDVDVHVEARPLHRQHLSSDVVLTESHATERRVRSACGSQQQGAPTEQRAVGPHLEVRDGHVL